MIDRLKRLYHKLPSPPSTNYNLRGFSQDPYRRVPRGALVLDVGSKSIKGQYEFATPPQGLRVLALDLISAPNVDVVADAHEIPLTDESVDCVMCVGMLLHCKAPWRVIAEMHRVLKPGGLIYVNTPFVFRYTPDPTDYYRFSLDGLRVLCHDFEEIQVGYNRGPASSMTELLIHFLAITFSFNRRVMYGILVDIFQWMLFWLKYLDIAVGRYETARIIHNGAFFFGQKPATSA
jgi:SAM-dependent methyltransferase